VSAKTEIAINASVETDSLIPGRDIQRLRAEMTTRPVRVPTLAGTAGPRVKGTAPNALRKVRNQTVEATEATRRLIAGEESRSAVSRKTGSQIVSARPAWPIHRASARPIKVEIGGLSAAEGLRTATPPPPCTRSPKSASSLISYIPTYLRAEPLPFDGAHSILVA
jgi:hypothetical protein